VARVSFGPGLFEAAREHFAAMLATIAGSGNAAS
jgi:hypothetical protein